MLHVSFHTRIGLVAVFSALLRLITFVALGVFDSLLVLIMSELLLLDLFVSFLDVLFKFIYVLILYFTFKLRNITSF